jgi:protoheme IX farnesyltransferase
MLPTGKKRQGYRFAGYFVYGMAYYSVITALVRLLVGYLYPVAAVVILLGVWMLFYAVKLYKLRTAKAAKALMLVSVGYITLLQLVYIIDKFLR